MPGSLMIGPLPQNAADNLIAALADNDVFVTLEDAEIRFERAFCGGCIVTAEGHDVLGYLQGSDGSEAPSHDIERAVRQIMPDGSKLLIQGHHRLAEDHFVVCKMFLTKQDGRVTSKRSHIANKIGVGSVDLVKEGGAECTVMI